MGTVYPRNVETVGSRIAFGTYEMNGVVAAVVVAAGRGFRAGGEGPKQYREIGGEPVIRTSLKGLAGHPGIAMVQPVIHPDDIDLFRAAAAGLGVLEPVFGGATRQASVRAGLEALSPRRPDLVLVHDAARPFASAALIARGIAAAGASGAAIPAVAVADTVKTVDASGIVTGTLERAQLRLVQTPQAFGFASLLAAHERARAAGREDFTDDSALVEWAGIKVSTFEGEAANVKLTTGDDFIRVGAAELATLADVRTGSGYDVHAFGPGDHVTLGGVRIAHSQGLSGHSDADVVLHALVDAILGALADGDIGVHFPPSDPQWRGASSDRFLAFAIERLRARKGRVAHLDVNVICEAPRIGPHRDAMRQRIAEIAGIDIGRVAVKATTSEKLGFIGRSEGMAAFATATVRLPWKE
jgi:2-C-methyl-D-erythritol 4-phosphate cytidylyltransferase / 2-C-methyl-D-erythritol 2,4-cyclodiphosphate synthase